MSKNTSGTYSPEGTGSTRRNSFSWLFGKVKSKARVALFTKNNLITMESLEAAIKIVNDSTTKGYTLKEKSYTELLY